MSDIDNDEDLFKVSFSYVIPKNTKLMCNEQNNQIEDNLPNQKNVYSEGHRITELADTVRLKDSEASPAPPSPPPPVVRQHIENPHCKKVISHDSSFNTSQLESDDDCVIIVGDGINTDVTVRVRCHSGIQRFTLNKNSNFSNIYDEVAQNEGIPVNSLRLYLNNSRVYPTDSPSTIDVDPTDIIDCYRVTENAEDCKPITLYVQSKMHKDKLSFTILPAEPIELLMKQYSTSVKVPLNRLSFRFDGEVLDNKRTTTELEITDGDCLDVQHL